MIEPPRQFVPFYKSGTDIFTKVTNDCLNVDRFLVQWQEKTTAYTAVAGDYILADTETVGAFTVTLPVSASQGDSIRIVDANGTFAVTNLTVARNGLNIRGVAADLTLDVNWDNITLIYVDATVGWWY